MKKILISIPLILVIVLSCVPVFTVSASYTFNEATDGYTEETAPNGPAAVDFSGSYFWFHTSLVDWSQIVNCSYQRCDFYWAYLDIDDSRVSQSEENGVFHWMWTGHPFYGFYQTYSAKSGNTDRSNFNGNMDFVYYCQDLYYDTATGAVWSETGNTTFGVNPNSTYPYAYKQQHLVLDGQDYDSDALRVHVDTGNQLSGEFTINNTDLFSVNVSNSGNTAVQWLFAIVESGTYVTFDLSRDLSAADIVNHSSNIKYLLLRGENCLLPAGEHNSLPYTSLSQVGGLYTDYINAYVQTSFHHLGAGDSDSCHIFWEMVDLKPGVNYDCVAYAMKSYADCTTYLLCPATNNFDMADTDSLQEVFRQPFTISNPKKYDSSVNVGGSGGLIANNGDSDFQAIHTDIHGYTDSGGNYYDYKGTYLGVSDYNVNNSTAGSSSKFNSLITQTNGVMRFFSQTLGYFPNEFLQVIQLGMFALVVIAIIKRVS